VLVDSEDGVAHALWAYTCNTSASITSGGPTAHTSVIAHAMGWRRSNGWRAREGRIFPKHCGYTIAIVPLAMPGSARLNSLCFRGCRIGGLSDMIPLAHVSFPCQPEGC
jgi:hypothetical protein